MKKYYKRILKNNKIYYKNKELKMLLKNILYDLKYLFKKGRERL